MKISLHRIFVKHYRKRILPHQQLDTQYKNRLELFLSNPKHPLLRDHKLTGGKADKRAFWITGDVRVVYKIIDNDLFFYDIGSHNQVY